MFKALGKEEAGRDRRKFKVVVGVEGIWKCRKQKRIGESLMWWNVGCIWQGRKEGKRKRVVVCSGHLEREGIRERKK